MSTLNRLRKRESEGQSIRVAVSGAGFMARGIVKQTQLTPGMGVSLVVSRQIDNGIEALTQAGVRRADIVASDKLDALQHAIDSGRPAVTTQIDALRDLHGIDCVVEATGAVEHGTRVALRAIDGRKHIIMMNAEADATVGCALKRLADEAGVVFSDADGDQPGVLMRMIDWVRGAGLEVVAAVNCKGFMDVHATPDTVRPWCEKQNTSPAMTTSMADGTKMNLENAVIANATGLLPEVRGMHGITTDLAHALNDCTRTFRRRGVVDYTLGGDFGGGVFVIGHSRDPAVQPYLKYLKMGDGPNYLFFRPYHLCHLETPMSIAEAVLDGEPTIAPLGPPLVEVIACAKRDLRAGEPLDGIGGYTMFGRIDTRARCRGMLPIGMANGARMIRSVRQDEPILLDAVQLGDDPLLTSLREQQECLLQVA